MGTMWSLLLCPPWLMSSIQSLLLDVHPRPSPDSTPWFTSLWIITYLLESHLWNVDVHRCLDQLVWRVFLLSRWCGSGKTGTRKCYDSYGRGLPSATLWPSKIEEQVSWYPACGVETTNFQCGTLQWNREVGIGHKIGLTECSVSYLVFCFQNMQFLC